MNTRFAGFWIRVLASILDSLIVFIPMFLIDYLCYALFGSNVSYFKYNFSMSETLAIWTAYDTASVIVSILFGLWYWCWFTSKFGGTLGKLMLGLRVVGQDGHYISFARAIGRYFAYIPASIFCIGYIMVAFNSEKQGMHDMMCKTHVLYK